MGAVFVFFGRIVFAFLLNALIIAGTMWALLRFMYPKPPKDFFAKAGDDTSVRRCDRCGGKLATYRGIFVPKALPANTPESAIDERLLRPIARDDKGVFAEEGYFFCNVDHQIAYCQARNLPTDALQDTQNPTIQKP